MKTKKDLQSLLKRIDGKGYKAYKDVKGLYDLGLIELFIDHVQGDPFAAPSRLRVRVKNTFPEYTYKNNSREVATRDFLTRMFASCIKEFTGKARGSGKSGSIKIDQPGQEIIERTSVVLKDSFVEARFEAGLPAFGRKIAGREALILLLEEIPKISENSLFFNSVNEEKLKEHINVCEDADVLRAKLREHNLVAFVSNEAVLPRASGINPKPLENAIPFYSPLNLEKQFELPNRTITGMGIPEGITLIVGGGYHGKSTLLNAVELGIYNHIPGDGREFVVSDFDAVKIRAEDGRSVKQVNISPFIQNLPQQKDTESFTSENASGSTSQAANIIEYLEAGARVMLIDEDTTATNFMIRDERMQKLVPKDKEPITPYIDKARQLYEQYNVSTLLVIGGSGAYFDIADTVICMHEYEPFEMTKRAKNICETDKLQRISEGGSEFGKIQKRSPKKESINPNKGNKRKLSANLKNIQIGTQKIDLSYIEQLADESQTRAICNALVYATKYMDGKRQLSEIIEKVLDDIEQNSLDVLSHSLKGNFAMFRKLELAAALNRHRELLIA
ncbi:MAG: ABC-ATPase domain-containing protein [Candidatus Nanoarchaeia archaeon]